MKSFFILLSMLVGAAQASEGYQPPQEIQQKPKNTMQSDDPVITKNTPQELSR